MNELRDEESRLREALGAAVPEPPDADGRTEALVRRRREQRHRRVAAVGATAAVVAAVAVGTTLTGGPQSSPEAGGPSARHGWTSTPTQLAPTSTARSSDTTQGFGDGKGAAQPDCPDPRLASNGLDAPVQIPADASSVWVCEAQLGAQSSPADLPTDATAWRTPGLMGRVRDTAVADPDRCQTVKPLPQPYTVWWTVGGQTSHGVVTSTCTDVTVAGRTIASADFLEALRLTLGSGRTEHSGTGAGPYGN